MAVGRTIEVFSDSVGRAECRSCRAAISWAEIVKSGKKMCFDGEIVALRTFHNEDHRLVLVVAFDTNHWRTCPNAKDHKR